MNVLYRTYLNDWKNSDCVKLNGVYTLSNFRVDGFPKTGGLKYLSIMPSSVLQERPEFAQQFEKIDQADMRYNGRILGFGQCKVFDACRICFKSIVDGDECKTCGKDTKHIGFLVRENKMLRNSHL